MHDNYDNWYYYDNILMCLTICLKIALSNTIQQFKAVAFHNTFCLPNLEEKVAPDTIYNIHNYTSVSDLSIISKLSMAQNI